MATTEKLPPAKVQDKSSSPSSEQEFPSADESVQEGTLKKITKVSAVITVIVSGLALFSDGYNAQIIGYMEPLFTDLYKNGFKDAMATRLSNSYLIGEIFGMLFFGYIIDKIGRRTGVVFASESSHEYNLHQKQTLIIPNTFSPVPCAGNYFGYCCAWACEYSRVDDSERAFWLNVCYRHRMDYFG